MCSTAREKENSQKTINKLEDDDVVVSESCYGYLYLNRDALRSIYSLSFSLCSSLYTYGGCPIAIPCRLR